MERLTFGVMEIEFPDENYSGFFISQDMVDLFKVETNEEALRLIREALREKLERKVYNRIEFDQESDAVIISIAKGELMFEVALILNNMLDIHFPSNEAEQIKRIFIEYKRPKKQRWKKGDIFVIPLVNKQIALGQIVKKDGTFGAICSLSKEIYNRIPDTVSSIQGNSQIFIPIQADYLNDYTYKIIANLPYPHLNLDQEEVENFTLMAFSSSILIELSEALHKLRPWNSYYEEVLELESDLRQYLSQ